jgi:ribonuclease BN (tRNA processing enzyme)
VADLGLGAIHGLLHEGLRHNDVDALLFTHLHPDHTAELSSFLFAANYDHHPRTGPLRVVGGPGFLAFFRALESAHGDWLEPRGYRREVEELSCGQSFGLGPLSVRSGPVRHLPSSLAFRFESGRASVVLSGDTGPSPEIEAFAAGADLLVLEAGNAGREPGTGSDQHLTPRQAGEVARRAGARALVLHHLPVGGAAAAEAEREATEAFGAPAVAARDGRRFEVTAVRS